CETKSYAFSAGTSDPVRVTLAWDDFPFANPYAPLAAPRLVNDLDLILIDPNGQPHYPWKLDQKIVDAANVNIEIADAQQSCTIPVAVQRQFVPTLNPATSNDTIPAGGVPVAVEGRDHLNNVEVVDVDAPAAAGTWQVQVIGFYLSQGPQSFSLAGYDFVDV